MDGSVCNVRHTELLAKRQLTDFCVLAYKCLSIQTDRQTDRHIERHKTPQSAPQPFSDEVREGVSEFYVRASKSL